MPLNLANYLSEDVVPEIFSWFDEMQLEAFEKSHKVSDRASSGLSTNSNSNKLCRVIDGQWKRLCELDENRKIPRWNFSYSSIAKPREMGTRYALHCRLGQQQAREARQIYDFDSDQPKSNVVKSLKNQQHHHQLMREIPLLSNVAGDVKKDIEFVTDDWQRWDVELFPGYQEVFVTITKRDTGWTWQGFRLLEKVPSSTGVLSGSVRIGSWQHFAIESGWTDLTMFGMLVETATKYAEDFNSETTWCFDKLLRTVLRNMQVTITARCGGNIVVATGGTRRTILMQNPLRVIGLFHERHPENPLSQSIQTAERLQVEFELQGGDIQLSLHNGAPIYD